MGFIVDVLNYCFGFIVKILSGICHQKTGVFGWVCTDNRPVFQLYSMADGPIRIGPSAVL